MPARWLDLLMRINHTFDQADTDLSREDRNAFYTHVLGSATRHQSKHPPLRLEHPMPTGSPLYSRDPAGE